MIMAFLLVVVVEGNQLPETWYFRSILRCNQFASYVEHGTVKAHTMNNKISAYCIPASVPPDTRFWD